MNKKVKKVSEKTTNKYEQEVLRLAREWYNTGGVGRSFEILWEAVAQMCEHENLAKYQEQAKK